MKINLEGDEVLERFVEQLMRDKGISEENKEEKSRLLELLDAKIDAGILGTLSDDRLRSLEEELDKEEPSGDRINAIVYGSGANFEKVVLNVMEKFKKDYLEGEK